MVKHAPATMLGVIIAFSVTAVVALVPMGVLLAVQHDASWAVGATAVAVPAAAALVVLVAVAAVALGIARRPRPAGA